VSADAGAAPFDIDGAIRRIPDHPHAGILFYDLMPLFQSAAGLAALVDGIADWARPRRPDVVLGVEARGFVLGGAVASALGVGFAAARKPGKLPGERIAEEYALEYGTDALELHRDAIVPGQSVLLHDDLLATGGTALAACRLVEALGGTVAGIAVVAELTFLPGRRTLAGYDVMSLVTYDSEVAEP
jgi:adenine phosphoribosyltransferase